MVLAKRMPGLGWLALIAILSLCLVSTGVSSSYAQSSDPGSTKVGIEGDDGTDAGDPDMPTGDSPPPSTTGASTTYGDGNAYRGHVTHGGIDGVTPERRYGLWAHWKLALKLFARGYYLR